MPSGFEYKLFLCLKVCIKFEEGFLSYYYYRLFKELAHTKQKEGCDLVLWEIRNIINAINWTNKQAVMSLNKKTPKHKKRKGNFAFNGKTSLLA